MKWKTLSENCNGVPSSIYKEGNYEDYEINEHGVIRVKKNEKR